MNTTIDYKTILAVGAVGLGLYLYFKNQAEAAVTAAGAAISAAAADVNPLNPNNIIASGANAFTQAVTGQPTTSVGSELYDLLNPASSTVPTTTPGTETSTDWGILSSTGW